MKKVLVHPYRSCEAHTLLGNSRILLWGLRETNRKKVVILMLLPSGYLKIDLVEKRELDVVCSMTPKQGDCKNGCEVMEEKMIYLFDLFGGFHDKPIAKTAYLARDCRQVE